MQGILGSRLKNTTGEAMGIGKSGYLRAEAFRGGGSPHKCLSPPRAVITPPESPHIQKRAPDMCPGPVLRILLVELNQLEQVLIPSLGGPFPTRPGPGGDPFYLICTGRVNRPGIKVSAPRRSAETLVRRRRRPISDGAPSSSALTRTGPGHVSGARFAQFYL